MAKILSFITDKEKEVTEKKLEEILRVFLNNKNFSMDEEKELVDLINKLVIKKIRHIKMKQIFLEQLREELDVKKLSIEPAITVLELSNGYLLQTADIIDKLGLEQFGKFICLFDKNEDLVTSFPLESSILHVDEKNCYIVNIAKTCEHYQYCDNKWQCVQIFGNVAMIESLSSKLKQIRHTSGSYSLYNQENCKRTIINYDNLNEFYLSIGKYQPNNYYQLEKLIMEDENVALLTFFVDREGELQSQIFDFDHKITYSTDGSLIDVYYQTHESLKKILKK